MDWMPMEWYMILAVIGIGFMAGFINTLAGGGSLLTLPLLIFLGLPANVANGTNRVALILQNMVAVGSFRQQRVLDLKTGIRLALPAVIGSLIGAQIAVNLNEEVMEKTIGALLVVMFFIILYKPDKWVKEQVQTGSVRSKTSWLQVVLFFFIGIYGGFIQAGVGFFLLAALVLGAGIDLVRANPIKLLVVLVYNIFALGVFLFNDQVRVGIGLILAIGNMLGAFVGSRMAVKRGAGFVRIILLVTLLLSAAKLVGLLDPVIGMVTG